MTAGNVGTPVSREAMCEYISDWVSGGDQLSAACGGMCEWDCGTGCGVGGTFDEIFGDCGDSAVTATTAFDDASPLTLRMEMGVLLLFWV